MPGRSRRRNWPRRGRSEFVVLPGNTADVQAIIKLDGATSTGLPYSGHVLGADSGRVSRRRAFPNWCQIDPKRMDSAPDRREEHVRVVEPYVDQCPAAGGGHEPRAVLRNPLCGGASSVMGNHLLRGDAEHGVPHRLHVQEHPGSGSGSCLREIFLGAGSLADRGRGVFLGRARVSTSRASAEWAWFGPDNRKPGLVTRMR